MAFIFEKLPADMIKKILLYNDNFTIRKGEIVSIIPKNDYRYKLLSKITLKLNKIYDNICYNYFFPNLYNYEERNNNNNDLFQVSINEQSNGEIKYSVWIGRQIPKIFECNKRQFYHIENPDEYNWIYTEYEYIRK
jgi:hypothetical protein